MLLGWQDKAKTSLVLAEKQLQGSLLSNESSYRHKKTPLCYTCYSPQTQERHRDAKSLYYKRQTFDNR